MMGGSNEVTVRIPDELCELGRYGQKNAKGYYRYEEGDRTPLTDPEADEVIKKVAEEMGYTRREFSDDEILKRCMYPLVNIGAKLLEEGHALRAGDIDTVYVNGYGSLSRREPPPPRRSGRRSPGAGPRAPAS